MHGSRGRDFGDTGTQRTPEEIDMLSMTGLFDVDGHEVIKRLKVSDETIQREIHVAIANFVLESGEVSTLHASDIAKIMTAEESMTRIQGQIEAGQEVDRASVSKVVSAARESMSAVRLSVAPLHKVLNDRITELLSGNEKQLKKWNSYYRNLCTEHRFNPNMPEKGGGEEQTEEGRPEGGGRPSGGPGGGGGGRMM